MESVINLAHVRIDYPKKSIIPFDAYIEEKKIQRKQKTTTFTKLIFNYFSPLRLRLESKNFIEIQ